MSASHHHNHGHSAHSHHDRHGPHGHMPTNFSRAFALGIALNITYIIVEVVYGLLAGSMALLADAGHNLSDVLGLAVAWAGAELAKRPPSKRFTYGLGGSSILAALLMAFFSWSLAGPSRWKPFKDLAPPAQSHQPRSLSLPRLESSSILVPRCCLCADRKTI